MYTNAMLDIQFIRDNPDLVIKKSAQKGYDVDVTQLLGFDSERRQLLQQVEALRRERNELTGQAKGQKPSEDSLTRGREIKDQLGDLEHRLAAIEDELMILLKTVPNVAMDDVPIGDESASVEVGVYGATETGGRDHLDLLIERGFVDFERGAKVAGNKFYFLKGDLALLENAITQFALNFVLSKGFTFMTVPHMVNGRVATGTGFAPRTSDQSDEYFIEGEDLSLIATAEMPLTGYHADEILDEKDLPLLYAGLSPCYRKEAGSYGKHTRGLFRVHQFNKLEMYAYTLPGQSSEMHEKLRAIEEELWQKIGIPYHVINIASGDLGAPAAKKYDLEYWSKVDGAYRELTSCSNCTDFQTRNLNIRVRRQDGTITMAHSLNGTAVSLARSIIAVVEHYQTPEGKILIPEVLQPFMGGRTEI
jgi:seryl-tRNA synthetase